MSGETTRRLDVRVRAKPRNETDRGDDLTWRETTVEVGSSDEFTVKE